MRWFG
jgi:transposase